MAGLTVVPARFGAHQPVTEVLQSEWPEVNVEANGAPRSVMGKRLCLPRPHQLTSGDLMGIANGRRCPPGEAFLQGRPDQEFDQNLCSASPLPAAEAGVQRSCADVPHVVGDVDSDGGRHDLVDAVEHFV